MKNEKEIVFAAEKKYFSEIERGILNTLLYFDVFKYPLTREEIHKYCQCKSNVPGEINASLDFLVNKNFINHSGGFYFVSEDHSIIERRINGNILADKFDSTAKKYSGIISKFPYVRAVFISGSLSKSYMDKDSDIDYFIITAPARLWLSRTLLVLFKKIFLLNSHKYFCVNYFIDETNLEIPDKNIFTATELVTLIPMMNTDLFEKFLKANTWSDHFLPNANTSGHPVKKYSSNYLKSFLERTLDGFIGNKLDDLCLRITLRYWKKKFIHFSPEDFENALRSKKDVSKHHPNKFQEKVLALYDAKIEQFEKKHVVSLSIRTLLNDASTSLFQ